MSKKHKKNSKAAPVERSSANLLAESVAELKRLFPEVVAEGKVDFAKLRAVLGDEVDDRPERYSFTWAGKRDAIRLLQTPSRATLVPAPEESVDFDSTNNVFIEGENLEVLKLLYKSYAGRVKMIYIDPPYNTGNDFIYPDNFTDPLDTYLKLTGQKDSQGNLLTSNPESSGRYHSAWLTMMYPRLFVARQLLREDGVIFVSIDDNEVHDLRFLMNEVFGEENFVATIVWQKKYAVASDDQGIGSMHDYIVAFSRGPDFDRGFLPRTEKQFARYVNPDNDPRGDWASDNYLSNKNKDQRPTLYYPIEHPKTGAQVWPPEHAVWRYSRAKHEQMVKEKRLYWGPDRTYERPRLKRFRNELKDGVVPSTWWPHTDAGHNDEAKKQLAALMGNPSTFSTPKPVRLLRRLLQIGATEPDCLVLDFFAGSCVTTHAVLELNREDGGRRQFIMVQLPEAIPADSLARKSGYQTIADIGKERIRRVIKKLKDDAKGKLALKHGDAPEDLGFKVFKLAESNYRPWSGVENTDGEAYAKTMEMYIDPLLPGWDATNVIHEVAMKEGYSLTCGIEKVEGVAGNTVHRVTDADKGQSFLICLDDKLKDKAIKTMDLNKDHLFICRDAALTDAQAANLALQCKLKTI